MQDKERTPCKWIGWPPPITPPGIWSSTVALSGKGMTLPTGKRSCGFCVPFRIWRSTGTGGGLKLTPFTVNNFAVESCDKEASKQSILETVELNIQMQT